MINTTELRKGLSEVWNDLRAGKITANEAKELTNMAGKVIASAKLDIEYQQMLNRRPEAKPMPFFNDAVQLEAPKTEPGAADPATAG